MFPQHLNLIQFKQTLSDSLQASKSGFPSVSIPKHSCLYMCGDEATSVFFIESGQLKSVMVSPDGKECLLSIHTSGDILGELCLAADGSRQETAIAMEETVVKRIPCQRFFQHLKSHSLLEGFAQYLVTKVAEQQHMIAKLLMVDSEHRLGETLLLLAKKIGQADAIRTRITQKITHEELSEMVGTTRPRVTEFMRKFRRLGLIEITPEHVLIIKRHALTEYLAHA